MASPVLALEVRAAALVVVLETLHPLLCRSEHPKAKSAPMFVSSTMTSRGTRAARAARAARIEISTPNPMVRRAGVPNRG